jgi:hypothetical protein
MISSIKPSWQEPEMRVLSSLRELEISLKDWERYQRYSLEDLKKDRDKRNMILHAMLVSIQSAIDISSYLISQNGLKRPETYRETFLASLAQFPKNWPLNFPTWLDFEMSLFMFIGISIWMRSTAYFKTISRH